MNKKKIEKQMEELDTRVLAFTHHHVLRIYEELLDKVKGTKQKLYKLTAEDALRILDFFDQTTNLEDGADLWDELRQIVWGVMKRGMDAYQTPGEIKDCFPIKATMYSYGDPRSFHCGDPGPEYLFNTIKDAKDFAIHTWGRGTKSTRRYCKMIIPVTVTFYRPEYVPE